MTMLKPAGLPLLWCPWCGHKSFRVNGRKNDPVKGWMLAGRCETCRAYVATAPGDVPAEHEVMTALWPT